jgi:hypothetical protein
MSKGYEDVLFYNDMMLYHIFPSLSIHVENRKKEMKPGNLVSKEPPLSMCIDDHKRMIGPCYKIIIVLVKKCPTLFFSGSTLKVGILKLIW